MKTLFNIQDLLNESLSSKLAKWTMKRVLLFDLDFVSTYEECLKLAESVNHVRRHKDYVPQLAKYIAKLTKVN